MQKKQLKKSAVPAFLIDSNNRKILELDSPSKFGQKYYSPFQTKDIIHRVELLHGQKVKVDAIMFMINSGHVPVKRSAFYSALSRDVSETSEWFARGAPSKIDTTQRS